jgi:hypothetical protein
MLFLPASSCRVVGNPSEHADTIATTDSELADIGFHCPANENEPAGAASPLTVMLEWLVIPISQANHGG